MKQFLLLAVTILCLLCLIFIPMALAPSQPAGHGGPTADLQLTMSPMGAGVKVLGLPVRQTQRLIESTAAALLVTAIALVFAQKRHAIVWIIREEVASLKARVKGALAAGDQLKFPSLSG